MPWKRFSTGGHRTLTGPGRIALAASVQSNPTTFASIISTSTYDFNATYTDLGPTDGGVTISKGFAEQVYSHDHATEVKSEITGNTMTITCTLAESGLISRFDYSWLTASGTSSFDSSTGVKKGIAAAATLAHRSAVVAEVDDNSTPRIRIFWMRDTTPVAQEAAYAMGNAAIHTLPISLRAFADTSQAAGEEYGYILEMNSFGT